MRGSRLLLVLALLAPAAAHARELRIGGAAIEVKIAAAEKTITDAELMGWVERAARAVTTYFGRFPVPKLSVAIGIDDRRGPHGGVTNGWPEPNIRIRVGRACPPGSLDRDWVLVHEMTHTSLPNVDRDHQAWAEEGLATYVEPIARLRAGQLGREEVWGDMVHDMPQGSPEAGDQGLDRTPTWGRTYWGGAQFWLVADVEIRRRTQTRLGLEDALKGIQAAGGDVSVDWPLDRCLAVADRAVGVQVLAPLYAKMKEAPAPVDLPALWAQLGIRVTDGRVTFDDAAPLASVRRAIETGRP